MGLRRTPSRAPVSLALAFVWALACASTETPNGAPKAPPASGAAGDPSGSAGEGSGAGATGGTSSAGVAGVAGESGAGGEAQASGGAAGDAPAPGGAGAGGQPELPEWSGSIGSLCAAGDRRTRILSMSPERKTCAARAEDLSAAAGEFIRAELPLGAQDEPIEVAAAPARLCREDDCRDGELALSLKPEADGSGASGTFTFSAAGKRVETGRLATARCAWDDYVPVTEPLEPGVRGLSLRALAVFQGVKVPLMERGIALAPNRAAVVADRAALFRAYVAPGAGWSPRAVQAKLTLANGDELTTFDDTAEVERLSDDADLESTFNFEVPAERVRADTRLSLELFETARCAAAGEVEPGRYPESGTVELGARTIGGLTVEILPLRIRRSGAWLEPDTSEPQIALLRQAILGIFPISGVELRVREPLNSSATTALEALDEVSALRDEENPGTHVSYYGMFRIAETLEEYCVGNCVLGASVVGEGANPRAGVGVGIGYTGDASARTFVHELGHVYGRQHSPCGVAGDPEFPYSGGRTGVWGYDLGQKTLMPPSLGDFMGYCEPLWVSDYVFGHLATFVGTVNAGVALLQRGEPARFRTILLERGARPRFGRSRRLSGEPPGKPEEAVAYARDGAATSTVVYRSSLADVEAELVYVPDPSDRDWTRVRLRSGELVEY